MTGQPAVCWGLPAPLFRLAHLGSRLENRLLVRILRFLIFCFGFERLQVPNRDLAAVDRNYAFSLQLAQTAGDKLSHRADLRREFLLTGRENELHPAWCTLSVADQAQQKGC